MNNFSEFILELGIIALPLLGANFTWFRGEDSPQASRIDRFLISPKWNDTFNAIKQLAMPTVLSDHRPLLLESGDSDTISSYFKFQV